MPADLKTFTRGSQLLAHDTRMFVGGLRLLLIAYGAIVVGFVSWAFSTRLTDHEVYLGFMRVQAAGYVWMEFDPRRPVMVEFEAGRRTRSTWPGLMRHPTVARTWSKIAGIWWQALWQGSLVGGFVVGLGWWAALRWGARAGREHQLRGARVASRRELTAEIAAHNRVERARDYARVLGPLWPLKLRLAKRREWDHGGLYRPYSIAGVEFPWGAETTHIMAFGTTGAGKTTAILDLLYQVRRRGRRAVVFDLTGRFIESFHRPDRDVILNPLDARCPAWSLFDDCTDENDFKTAAAALIPQDGGTSEPFWVMAARQLFVEACLALKTEGGASNRALADRIMKAELRDVHALLADTFAGPLTSPEAARMAESIRATLNVNANALLALPTDGDSFSIRRWIADSDADSFLFLAARPDHMATARGLLTLWMDMASNALLAQAPSRHVHTWFTFDELGALHRLPGLEAGLQTARQFGGAFLLGVHAIAKVRETYGDRMATTLASLARTKLILATADYETAKWGSEFIGHREITRKDEGVSYGANSVRDAVTLTPRQTIEMLVLPDDIMNLPNLYGYLKFPQGFPAAPVKLTYKAYRQAAPGFERRATVAPAQPPSSTPSGTRIQPGNSTSGAHDSGGQAAERPARQLRLNFGTPPRKQRTDTELAQTAPPHSEPDPLPTETPPSDPKVATSLPDQDPLLTSNVTKTDVPSQPGDRYRADTRTPDGGPDRPSIAGHRLTPEQAAQTAEALQRGEPVNPWTGEVMQHPKRLPEAPAADNAVRAAAAVRAADAEAAIDD